jgi:PleD family two-component response regulator
LRSPSPSAFAPTTLAGHERMLAMADRNLYLAKARGRNRVVG